MSAVKLEDMAATADAQQSPGLRKHIGLGHGIALYVSAILGAGVLVLPGQVASLAGPASLVSWAIACLMGVPLAVLFAGLARRYPDAGGVATYVSHGLGRTVGGIAGWMFFVAGAIGQTIVPLTGGYYLVEGFGLSHGAAYLIAGVILGCATAANLIGLKVSAVVQLAMATGVALLLVLAIVAAVPDMNASSLTPFAPDGLGPVGEGVIILFFAFAGWEAISHLVGEFHDPDRDLPRAVTATVLIVTVLYMGVAAAVVLTATYGTPAIDHVAIGLLLENLAGSHATLVAAFGALIISLGTTNAFIAGVSRLAYALARDGWLPPVVARVSTSSVPWGGVMAVGATAYAGLALAFTQDWGTETLIVVPSTLVVAVYILASLSGARLLRGSGRVAAVTALAISAVVAPSAAPNLLIPVAVIVIALLARLIWRPHNPSHESSTG